jgi:branched-chain amino acid transport system ATP-binding protein
MLLEAHDLHVSYGDIRAVSGVSFQVEKGELVSIIGANGAGKTSILSALMGIVPLEQGTISYNGRDISGLPAYRRARAGMRMVPERARVFPRLSVYENLMTGVYRQKKRLPLAERIAWLYDLFPVLAQRRDQAAATLSGGEQQQLAIARALISDPRLLLVDEVSMGLMPKLVDRVFELLQDLNRTQGLTILLVEQNALASLEISRRAYVLETGTCVAEGDTKELLDDPRIRQVYLGSSDEST